MFGNPETTTGGRALKFYASVRMDIRRIENIKQDGEIKGIEFAFKVVKNKVAHLLERQNLMSYMEKVFQKKVIL